MKKNIIVAILLTTVSSVFALNPDTLKVVNVSKVNGNTIATFERHHTSITGNYFMGSFSRSFKGDISNTEIVRKGSLLTDSNITVTFGDIKMDGQAQVLAQKRHEAFLDSLASYFVELAKQIADEK